MNVNVEKNAYKKTHYYDSQKRKKLIETKKLNFCGEFKQRDIL